MSAAAVEVTVRPDDRRRRPRARGPVAHPRRVPRSRARGAARACSVQRPRARFGAVRRWWLWGRVVLITLVAVTGGVVGVSGYVDEVLDGPTSGPQAGDPAWSHVEP